MKRATDHAPLKAAPSAPTTGCPTRRRDLIAWPAVLLALAPCAAHARPNERDRRWYDAALAQRRLAESWGDQPYGAVLVQDGRVIGLGPSRVVKNADPTAHAEREAIRDALSTHGTVAVRGSVLYSTSRPCTACERAAARVGVRRMFFGSALQDAGTPIDDVRAP